MEKIKKICSEDPHHGTQPAAPSPHATGKAGSEIKEKINLFLEKNFEDFFDEFRQIEKPEVKVKIYLDMLKLAMPRIRDEEENDRDKFTSRILKRMFPVEK